MKMENETSILIADDHPIFRQGLRVIIEREAGCKIIAEAEDGATALEKIQTLNPQIAVLDISMPNLNGFEIARAAREQNLAVRIIILTMYKDEKMLNEAIDLGVKGYVLKESALLEIVASIKTVARGHAYISPQLSEFLLNRGNRSSLLVNQIPGLNDLTPTEKRILKMIADCKTSKEIGAALHIDYRTVNNHRTNICQKLNIKGTHALLKFALENKSAIG